MYILWQSGIKTASFKEKLSYRDKYIFNDAVMGLSFG
jgi:hypothetical protein